MKWKIENSREIYNIPYWGDGYFDINAQGHMTVNPTRDRNHPGIDLYQMAAELRRQGLSLPTLIRFLDILRDRIHTLVNAFSKAMESENYQGKYTAIYPIKVNQQRRVVEEIIRCPHGQVGLEAGSKPELLAVLALARPGSVIICNGYKDPEFIRLALIGNALGHTVYLVIEKLSELERILTESEQLKIAPNIGVRVRLASLGNGKWQNTGGEKGKFGLSANQILQVIDRLKSVGMLDNLKLIHFHMGSQIANIRDIQKGLREASQYYAQLHRLGVPITAIDVGGGLGIDYDGTRSRGTYSVNYSLEEYANNIVYIFLETCIQYRLPHPDILTESGRATTAHHAMLITNVIDIEKSPGQQVPHAPTSGDPAILRDLWEGYHRMTPRTVVETYHDAVYWSNEAQSMFMHGLLTLEQRAQAEASYFATCNQGRMLLKPEIRAHREILDDFNHRLVDKYFCNFSLFRSLPDVWAIGQLFPIAPLHRLDQQPDCHGVIADLTCDSDGRVDFYVTKDDVAPFLPLHSLNEQPYLLGFFLVGAYQETLGDIHNLFGDTDSVNVELDGEKGYRFERAILGETVADVLKSVDYETPELMASYRRKWESIGEYPVAKKRQLLQELEAGLNGYTYLEVE